MTPAPLRIRTYQLFKRVYIDYAKPYTPTLIGAIACMLIVAATNGIHSSLVRPIVDDVFGAKSEARLYQVAIILLATFVVKGLAGYGESFLLSRLGVKVITQIQRDLVAHFVRCDVMFFYKNSAGELLSRVMNDVWLLRNSLTKGLVSVFKDTVTLVTLIGVMLYQDLTLSILALVVCPAAIFPVINLGHRMRRVSRNTQQVVGRFSTFLIQLFQGIRVVKSYVMEPYELKKANELIDEHLSLTMKNARITSATHPIMETIGGIAIVTVISYGGYQVIHGQHTAGAFFSFMTAFIMAYEPMKRLAQLNLTMQEGFAAATRMFEMMHVKTLIHDVPHPQRSSLKNADIHFDNVSFAFGDNIVLDGLNLRIKAGQMTALVGASGSGKTTILNLLPRFFDVSDGHIRINSHELRDIEIAHLRQNIAFVSQDITLFDDTIRANIAYGRMDASEAEIIEAAKQAAAHDFIQELPEGYDTFVGENGLKLSGGQRQRIAIARAILKNAPVLLLDEATSALDNHSEKVVHSALEHLMLNRTTLIVAHRLSTIMKADKIAVIEGGRVVEEGTHQELLAKEGIYKALAHSHFE